MQKNAMWMPLQEQFQPYLGTLFFVLHTQFMPQRKKCIGYLKKNIKPSMNKFLCLSLL